MKKMIMKKSLLLLLALMTSIPMSADVQINATNFPDANFRNYLLTNEDPITSFNPRVTNNEAGINGYGKDGVLTNAELQKINGITIKNVANLKGIELLPRLYYLNCTGIATETVNLSANTYLMSVELQGSFKSVNIPSSFLYALKLDAPLTSLDLRNNEALNFLQLKNTNLSAIDLSMINTQHFLQSTGILNVGIYNQKKQFNLTTPSVKFVLTISNSVQTNVDFSNSSSMKGLYLKDNKYLTSLTLPTEKARLIDLVVHNNPLLTSLNVEDYTHLRALSYRGNGFKTVDVTKNDSIRFLECYGNGLTSLNVSNNKVLNHLFCQDNLLTSLDLSNNPDLRSLECYNNQLTELDLSNNPYLRTKAIEMKNWNIKDPLPEYYMVSFPDQYKGYGLFITTLQGGGTSGGPITLFTNNCLDFSDNLYYETPSIILSPQSLIKDYVAIDGRSKLGVQCNTNNGVLTSYGNYTAMTSDGNNYIMVADEANGKSDVHAPSSSINYNYNTRYTGTYDAQRLWL